MRIRVLALAGIVGATWTLFATAQQPESGQTTPVELTGNPINYSTIGNDTILLEATDEDLAILQALIEQLDSETERPGIQLLTLANGSASEIGPQVESLFKDVYPNVDITVVTDEGSNSLIIAAPENVMAKIIELATNLDNKTPPLELEFSIVQLEYIPASEAAELLMAALEQAVQQSPSGAKILEKIKIIPIDRNSTLNVTAPQEYLQQITELIKVYDVEPQGLAKAQLLYIPLLQANAETLAGALEDIFNAQGSQAEELREKILRLRFTKVAPDGTLEPLPELDLEKPIKIVAEQGTNALIIATHTDNAEPVREIVQLLDSVPTAPEIGIDFFPLKYADAETVAATLKELFDGGKSLPDTPGDRVKNAVPKGIPGKALVYNVSVHADTRSNTIVVSGRAEQVALAHTVISQLDVEGRSFFPQVEFLYLENADPQRVASMLIELNTASVTSLEARNAGTAAVEKAKATILHDLQSNALVIMATEDTFKELTDIAAKLDAKPSELAYSIRIVNCAKTNAATISTKIDELWARKEQLLTENDLPKDSPVVVADERSNALVIASSIEDYDAIRKLVEDLEAQPLAPLAMIRLIDVKNNDAEQLGNMLKGIFDARLEQRGEDNDADKVAIAAEATTNTMLIASSPENFEEIHRIVTELDVIPEIGSVVKTFIIEHADAANIEGKIKDLVVTQGLYRPGAQGDSQVSEAQNKVAMISDARANAIVVSASKPNLAIIEQLIKEMDRDDILDLGATRIFGLTHVDTLKVADILTQVFDGLREAAGSGESQDVFIQPTFIPVEASNALIVTGSRDAMKRTEDLLARIDQPSDSPSAKFEVYSLKRASCVQIAPKVDEMFEARASGGDSADGTPMTIQAVEGSNSLLVSASREDHIILDRLIQLLDIESSLNQQLRIFNLEKADAEDASTVLTELFQSQSAGGTDGPVAAIAVEPVIWTNSIVVWAAAGQMEDIESMISKLDTNMPSREMRLEAIQLHQAMAEDLAEALTLALEGDGNNENADMAVILSFFETRSDGDAELRKLLRQNITIVPYVQTNTLLVMAPPESVGMLKSLIQQLDDIPPPPATVEVFKLIHANAEQMIETLQTVFEGESGSSSDEIDQAIGSIGGVAAPAVAGAEGGGVLRALTFAPDPRTNSIIVAGNEQYIRIVGDLIGQLDGEAADERIIEVLQLNNSTAEELATALIDYSTQENERLSTLDDTRSTYAVAEQAITVVPDEKTNAVILGMSPRFRETYMTMVQELDRAPEQVLIEFMLIEVSLDDLFELGVEFAAQDLLFSEKAFTGPNGTINGPEFDFVVGTDLGAAGSGGGFSFTMTGEDFSFLFHALQTAGRAELISRPSLLVEDNAEDARIAIVNQVPTLRSLGSDNAGNAVTNIEYVDTGIELNVVPHINPDGFIQLEIDSQVNNVGPQVQVGGTSSVSIQGTELTTTVTVKDGETVIIGGLIETNTSESETKVPFFGDLPGVGQLFRTNSDSTSRRELLIVITTTVIRSEEDAYRMSIEQRDKTGIIPDRIKTNELMKGLRVQPPTGDDMPIQDRDMLHDEEESYGPRPTMYGPPKPSAARRAAHQANRVPHVTPASASVAAPAVVPASTKAVRPTDDWWAPVDR
jgi:type II secretion system protein D